jgi:hypothetical protein
MDDVFYRLYLHNKKKIDTKSKEKPKIWYSIEEIAKIFLVEPSDIRQWSKIYEDYLFAENKSRKRYHENTLAIFHVIIECSDMELDKDDTEETILYKCSYLFEEEEDDD